MNMIDKILLLAIALISLNFTAHGQNQSTIPQSAVLANNRFDLSGNACYHRMQDVAEIRKNKFRPLGDAWTAIHNYKGDDLVFGVPIGSWNDAVISEFYSALASCTEPPSMKSVWGDAFLDEVGVQFPSYLALAGERIGHATRFIEKSASTSGTRVSCAELTDYANNGYEPVADANSTLFGKTLAAYAESDYQFLADKIDSCINVIKEATTETDGLNHQTEHLLKLQQSIAMGWRETQREQISRQAARQAAQAQAATVAAEQDRRKSDPTLIERAGSYMVNAGLFGFMICVGMTAKKDKRTKSGYQRNWEMPMSLAVAGLSSLALMFLGWMIG